MKPRDACRATVSFTGSPCNTFFPRAGSGFHETTIAITEKGCGEKGLSAPSGSELFVPQSQKSGKRTIYQVVHSLADQGRFLLWPFVARLRAGGFDDRASIPRRYGSGERSHTAVRFFPERASPKSWANPLGARRPQM
jgi:hypothetical protein